jgi:competence protein ComEA
MKRLFLVLFAAFCSFNVIASPVNINTADAKTISEALSGIGLKKAEAIVKYREAKGEFKTVEDLVNVNGIGPKTVEKIKNDVLLSDTVATPAAAPALAPAEQNTDKKVDQKIEEKAK